MNAYRSLNFISKDAIDLQICEEITKELLKLPGASLFKEPLTNQEENFPKYSQIVKSPQDLGTILSRLKNKEYTNSASWAKDVDLVWTNAELYNGKDTYVAQIARHMQKHCEKLKRKLASRKIIGWMKNLIFFKTNFGFLFFSSSSVF